ASTRACTRASNWVARNSRRRGRRSASQPPARPNSSTGIRLVKATRPSRKLELVRRYTSQAWATFCIQVPCRDTSWPKKNSRYCRRCRERRTRGAMSGDELVEVEDGHQDGHDDEQHDEAHDHQDEGFDGGHDAA